MEALVKHFCGLSLDELYKSLRARVEMFIVEQNYAYQDADEADKKT